MCNTISPKMHVVLSQVGTFGAIINPLISNGALLHILDNHKIEIGYRLMGKLEIVLSMFSFRILKLRSCWCANDRVLILGWKAIPILIMIKLGIIRRPQKTLVAGCFVHGRKVRYIVNSMLKVLRFEGLGFVTFSRGESDNLINNVGVPRSAVYFLLWREDLGGKVQPQDIIEGDYIFSGGYSNRDYELLISALQGSKLRLVIVASSRSKIKLLDDVNVSVHYDLDEFAFEKLLAQSKLVVLPLCNQGEACGQSVLIRTLRNGKPLIATRHESIVDYLGTDYPGFVPAGNHQAMRSMVESAFVDYRFRNTLASKVSVSSELLEELSSPGQELMELLMI